MEFLATFSDLSWNLTIVIAESCKFQNLLVGVTQLTQGAKEQQYVQHKHIFKHVKAHIKHTF